MTITSAITWLALAVLVLLWLPLLAVIRLFDRDPALYTTGRWFRRLGWVMTRVNPAWQVEISGTPPADPRRPFVVVANHQSNADIPVISTLPWEMKWVGKAELFRMPVIGWLMRLAGDMPVDRGDPRSRSLVVRRARYYLERHCSVMFMPEGTRSRDGRVKHFQDGAFRLAIEAGVPVLPLAVDGTAGALPARGWMFGPVRCRVHVFEPVETTGLMADHAPELRERVRRQVVDKLAEWRGVSPADVDGAPGLEEATNSPADAAGAG